MPARPFTLPLKSLLTLVLVVSLFYYTGILGSVTQQVQRFALAIGALDASPGADESQPFPFTFDLVTLQGEVIPAETLKGKVLFINLWATWCGPCRAEMPGIENLHQEFAGKDVQFVMLSIDRGNDERIKSYIAKHEFTFPVFRPGSDLPEILDVPSIPTTFVIDKEGNVVYKKVGTARYNTKRFKEFLNEMLK